MPAEEKKTSKLPASKVLVTFGLVMIAAGAYSYYSSNYNTPQPVVIKEPEQLVIPVKKAEETIIEPAEVEKIVVVDKVEKIEPAPVKKEPVKKAAPKKVIKLPTLDESDTFALASAKQLSPLAIYPELLISSDLIRNFVVFTDNFSRGELLHNFSPLKGPSEKLSVVKQDGLIYLNEQSYDRYEPYVRIIYSIDTDFMISQYRIFKPYFDQAYQEIGYPENAFHNTLIEAIQTAIDTPIINQPVALIAPSVMYKFADPELEMLPAAQKFILRMGKENQLKLKEKLHEIQSALIALPF